MQLSARYVIEGRAVGTPEAVVTVRVQAEIGAGQTLSSSIATDTVQEPDPELGKLVSLEASGVVGGVAHRPL